MSFDVSVCVEYLLRHWCFRIVPRKLSGVCQIVVAVYVKA